MKELTLAQIGREIVRASKSLTPEQRGAMTFEALTALLQTKVGALPKIGAK